MSRSGLISWPLGGEERWFRLDLAAEERVQEETDMGVSLIVQSLHPFVTAQRAGAQLTDVLNAGILGDVRKAHVRSILFNGLIGAGVTPAEAALIRKTWIDPRPVLELASAAYAVGLACLVGPEDEDASGEPKGEDADRSPATSSDSEKTASTRSGRRRGSAPSK